MHEYQLFREPHGNHWRHVIDTAQLKSFVFLRRSEQLIFTAPANLGTQGLSLDLPLWTVSSGF
jgi:hypothetical protein